MKEFTTDELRTIVWMCQNQAAAVALRDLKNHKKPSENKNRQRIIAISKKAYEELIARNLQSAQA